MAQWVVCKSEARDMAQSVVCKPGSGDVAQWVVCLYNVHEIPGSITDKRGGGVHLAIQHLQGGNKIRGSRLYLVIQRAES